MKKFLKAEARKIASDLKYSDYSSFREFTEKLRGYEKLTNRRYKLGEYKVIEGASNEKEKALLLRRFTLVCDKNIIEGCTASIELGRNGDILKVFKFKDYHNHTVIRKKKFYSTHVTPMKSVGNCENGYVTHVFNYPSVKINLFYSRCPLKFCKSHSLTLEEKGKFFHIRRNPEHNHDSPDDDIDSDEEIGPRNVVEKCKFLYRIAVDIILRGLMAKDERDMTKALEDLIMHFDNIMRKL